MMCSLHCAFRIKLRLKKTLSDDETICRTSRRHFRKGQHKQVINISQCTYAMLYGELLQTRSREQSKQSDNLISFLPFTYVCTWHRYICLKDIMFLYKIQNKSTRYKM